MNPNHVYSEADVALVEWIVSQKLRNSMLWMVWGLVTTMLTGVALLFNSDWMRLAVNNYKIIAFVEIGVVFLFSMRAMTASTTALKAMFFLYSMLNGLTMMVIVLAYGLNAALPAFIGTLAFFVAFAIVGKAVKCNLSGFYPYLLAAVVAMVLVSLAMMFFNISSTWNLVLGYLGVLVFSIFTAVDVNRIKQNITAVALTEDESVLERVELIGALSLYLDFINLFLSFMRIFGRK